MIDRKLYPSVDETFSIVSPKKAARWLLDAYMNGESPLIGEFTAETFLKERGIRRRDLRYWFSSAYKEMVETAFVQAERSLSQLHLAQAVHIGYQLPQTGAEPYRTFKIKGVEGISALKNLVENKLT